ncbi:hypothetical protein MJH12_10200 [bacterium]|nr:hypothetical protein [bacterium]
MYSFFLKYLILTFIFIALVHGGETKFWFTEQGLQSQNIDLFDDKGKYSETHAWEVFRYKDKWCIPFESLSDLLGLRFTQIDNFDVNKPLGLIVKMFIPKEVQLSQVDIFKPTILPKLLISTLYPEISGSTLRSGCQIINTILVLIGMTASSKLLWLMQKTN